VDPIKRWFYPPQHVMPGLTKNKPGATFSHARFTEPLQKHVDERGMVAYGKLKKDEAALAAYLKDIAAANVAKLSHHEQLALLINAYNAFTLKLILENPRVTSIRRISKPWDQRRWNVGGRIVSLNDLEHKWIRPEYREPGIHFAVVCAALSCPRLRREAYTGKNLTSQLADHTRWFFAQPDRFRWDAKRKRLSISKLIDWYKKDFTSHSGSVARYVQPYVPPQVAASIQAAGPHVELHWLSYSWQLNGKW